MRRDLQKSSENFTAQPEVILHLIGPEGLEKIADQARRDCISNHIQKAITRWYAREAKTGRVKSLIDLGATMGCSKATASRYVRGQIRQTDLLQADLYLRRLGMSLKGVLPNEDEIRLAILAATIRAFHQARATSGSYCELEQLVTPEQVQAIERINQACPFTESVTNNEPRWREWLSRAAACVRAAFPTGRWAENGPKTFSWEIQTALMAADWQVAKKHLPWQVLAILTAAIEFANPYLYTNTDDTVFEPHLYRPTSDGSARYLPLTYDLKTTLRQLCNLETLPVVMFAFPPRSDQVSRYGRETVECWLSHQPSAENETVHVTFRFDVAFVPISDDNVSEPIPDGLTVGAVERFLLDGLFESVKSRIEGKQRHVRGCRGRRVSTLHWVLDVDATLPVSLTLRTLQRFVTDCRQARQRQCEDAMFRLHLGSSSRMWEKAWSQGAIGKVPLWTEIGCDSLVHRAEFWTAVWGDDEVGVWALFSASLDARECAGTGPASVLLRFGVTQAHILEWRRKQSCDTGEEPEDSADLPSALRKRRGGSSVDYDYVYEPRVASRDARLVMARASMLCMKYGHRSTNAWHVLLALLTIDDVATRLIENGAGPALVQDALEIELLQSHPTIVPVA